MEVVGAFQVVVVGEAAQGFGVEHFGVGADTIAVAVAGHAQVLVGLADGGFGGGEAAGGFVGGEPFAPHFELDQAAGVGLAFAGGAGAGPGGTGTVAQQAAVEKLPFDADGRLGHVTADAVAVVLMHRGIDSPTWGRSPARALVGFVVGDIRLSAEQGKLGALAAGAAGEGDDVAGRGVGDGRFGQIDRRIEQPWRSRRL